MTKRQLIESISEYPDDANIMALFNTDGKAVNRVVEDGLFKVVPKTTITPIKIEGKVTDILIVSERG